MSNMPELGDQFPVPQDQPRNEENQTSPDQQLTTILHGDWESRLNTDNYEDAAQALSEINKLRSWRSNSQKSSFAPFYRLFESASALTGARASDEMNAALVDRLTPAIQSMSPRVADLYSSLLAQMQGKNYTPQFEMTTSQLEALRKSGDLELLLDPQVPFSVKQNRMDTRVVSELQGRRALDRRDKALQDDGGDSQNQDEPSTPPAARDESKPGMDEMERLKEGDIASAIWTISPAYGGYFKEQSFDTWDSERNTWRQSEYKYTDINVDIDETGLSSDRRTVIQAQIPSGQWVRIPVPYTHSLVAGSRRVRIMMDQNGDYIARVATLTAKKDDPISFTLEKKERFHGDQIPQAFHIPGVLSEETQQKLEELRNSPKQNIGKARALAAYTMRRLTYSNDSSYNSVYDSHPKGYIGAIDELKQADCDVANTYFAGLCAQLGIPVRHVVGHMVKGKDQEGNSRITSGTGHGWSEIWDNEEQKWIRVDATPRGDPQLDEDKKDGDATPGDYGEQEELGPTDEELAQLEEKLAELTEKLSYSNEEKLIAQEAGLELAEARKIVKEIKAAENITLPNGEKVIDVLTNLFNQIVQSRTVRTPDYTGLLRKREGGEDIEDIVTHKIGLKAGESDPASRQKETDTTAEQKEFGGLDIYIVGDKSGSMSNTVDGEQKWKIQRQAEYLIFSSLYRFQQNLQRNNGMALPLSVRSEAISFRGSNDIDVDKPLSGDFTSVDKLRMWQSLGNQGMGNGDTASLQYIHDQIRDEKAELEAQGKVDDRLRMIIACSDGMPDDERSVKRLAQALGEMGTVVVGVGLTETAAQVPLIFDTPYSRGDIATDINDLPVIVAKHLVREAIKLFPEKSRKNVERFTDAIISKFS